jgi:hypothetical protein
MARVPEAAHPSGRIPGVAMPKHNTGQVLPSRSSTPAAEPALRSGSNMASRNKTAVRREPAFKTRPGAGSDV